MNFNSQSTPILKIEIEKKINLKKKHESIDLTCDLGHKTIIILWKENKKKIWSSITYQPNIEVLNWKKIRQKKNLSQPIDLPKPG
jgi:hypothetical protein